MMSSFLTIPAPKATGEEEATPGIERILSWEGSSDGIGLESPKEEEPIEVICTSPITAATPSRMACLKPDETATAMMMIRKLTVIEITAMFPWNFSFPDMKPEASIYQIWTLSSSGRNMGSPSLISKASKKDWKLRMDTLTLFSARE